MAEIPAGWYPDPSGNTTQLRYWNGSQWTDNYAPASYGTAQSEPPTPETQAEFVDAQTIPNPPKQPYTPPTIQPAILSAALSTILRCALLCKRHGPNLAFNCVYFERCHLYWLGVYHNPSCLDDSHDCSFLGYLQRNKT